VTLDRALLIFTSVCTLGLLIVALLQYRNR